MNRLNSKGEKTYTPIKNKAKNDEMLFNNYNDNSHFKPKKAKSESQNPLAVSDSSNPGFNGENLINQSGEGSDKNEKSYSCCV